MKKIAISAGILMWISFASVIAANGQRVPASVKKEIIGHLKKQGNCQGEYVQFSVDTVRIGPRRIGLIGSCRWGGGISVLYEKRQRALREMFRIEVGMNGYFSVGNKVFNGYYELSHYERSGPDVFGETYRWNGSRYVMSSSN